MKKIIAFALFLTAALSTSMQAQNLKIKINKNFAGAKNEKINLVVVGETYSGSNTVNSTVTPVLEGDYYVYTMTSQSNQNKVNAALNAGKRYRVFYHSTPTSSITATGTADVGNFTSLCKEGNIITIAAVGQSCQ